MTKKRVQMPTRDRATEYIDTALMRRRLKHGRNLSVQVEGNYGVYETRLRLGRRPEGRCSCPSEWYPCKHIRALEATWKVNPKSFVDLDEFLRGLAEKSSAELVKLIGRMAFAAPESLAACGFKDFEPERDDPEDI